MIRPAFTVWLTGLPCAGKTTIGGLVAEALAQRGLPAQRLDGDEVRRGLCADLGFCREDRHNNNLRVAWVAGLLNKWGIPAVVSQITPYQETRDQVRQRLENMVEVYLECPLEQLINRDVKGHYQKALAGEIKNFTGVDDPFEPPARPEVHCRTDRETPFQTRDLILEHLEKAGLIPAIGQAVEHAYSPEEEEVVKKRLADLGYI